MLNQFFQATISLLLLHHAQCWNRNVGSVLFSPYQRQDAWTLRDLERLRARRVVQEILPSEQCQNIDSAFIRNMLSYFNRSLEVVRHIPDENSRIVVTEALADAIGGYLRSELLPEARYAFYAGRVLYKDLQEINIFYQDAKDFLNTQGSGWAPPKRMLPRSLYGVETIDVKRRSVNPCSRLFTLRDSSGCVIVPKPTLIERENPSAIALPMRIKPLMSLFMPRSENVLIKYYKLASECILEESPAACRSNALVRLNRALCKWIDEEVRPHLEDEQLYVGFSSILRLSATVHHYCEMSEHREYPQPPPLPPPRRNTYSIHDKVIVENKKTLITLIFAIAAITWIFTWMLTSKENCSRSCSKEYSRLRTPPNSPISTSFGNEAPVKTTFKTVEVLAAPFLERKSPSKKSSNRKSSVTTLKGPDRVPVRTEAVYDMNEEKMKEMPIPECIVTERDQCGSVPEEHILDVVDIPGLKTLRSASAQSVMSAQLSAVSACSRHSPPRIDTHISQIMHKKNIRCEKGILHLPIYSTSEGTTATRSAAQSALSSHSAKAKVSESLSSSAAWTSSTEASSLAEDRRGKGSSAKRAVARIAKDLAWAKRLASRKKRGESKKE